MTVEHMDELWNTSTMTQPVLMEVDKMFYSGNSMNEDNRYMKNKQGRIVICKLSTLKKPSNQISYIIFVEFGIYCGFK